MLLTTLRERDRREKEARMEGGEEERKDEEGRMRIMMHCRGGDGDGSSRDGGFH